MQIDPSKSTALNMLALINSEALIKYQSGDVVFAAPTVIVPGVGNGEHNTQTVATPGPNLTAVGTVTVNYFRNTLATNRPGAGTLVITNNTDTFATIHTKIATLLSLLPEELVFTDPPFLPNGGESKTFTVNPKANSLAYAPGPLLMTVKNVDALHAPFDPLYLWIGNGTPSVGVDSHGVSAPMFFPRAFTLAEFGDNTKTYQEVFANFMNSTANPTRAGSEFTAEDYTFGDFFDIPTTDGIPGDVGFGVYAQMLPAGSDSPAAAPFWLAYNRAANFLSVAGLAGTFNTQPDSLMSLATITPFFTEMCRLFKIPLGVITPVSIQVVNANQTKLTVLISPSQPILHSLTTGNIVLTFNR